MDAIHTEDYRGYRIDIFPDDDSLNPRTDFDNLGKMVCWHSRYNLGDDHDFETPEDAREYFKETGAIFLPVYLYDHSGLTMNTIGFSCPWDSGQVGFVFVTAEQVRKEYSCKRIGKRVKWQVLNVLEAEVKVYDDYLTGNVYGYTVTDPGTDEVIDSCWGYYGDYDSDGGPLDCAREFVNYHVERESGVQMELIAR